METLVLAAALILGPSAAVLLMFWRERAERRYRRRLDTFIIMVRNRRLWLHQEWIGALNMVPVEFDSSPMVMEAWNALLDKFSDPAWRGSDHQRQRVILDTEAAVCALLQHMATAMKIDLPAQVLRSRNYTPTGWMTDDAQQRHEREMLFQILQGSRPLRVEIGNLVPPSSVASAPPAGASASPSAPYGAAHAATTNPLSAGPTGLNPAAQVTTTSP